MSKKIVILLLVIFIGSLLFPVLTLAGDYKYGNDMVHYEGLVPCGKSKSSLAKMYDEDNNLIKEEESLEISYPCEFCHLFVMLDGIIDFVLINILPPVVVLMLVIAGIMFFFAGGNPTLLLQAKKLITSVVIGVVIIFSAYLIVGTVLTAVDVQEWTTLREWFSPQGVFVVNCPIGEGGDGVVSPGEEEEEEWDKEKEITGESPLCDVDYTLDCDEGQKAENGYCEPGENTKEDPISKKSDDGKGWYCKFTAEFKPTIGGYLECYVPTGTIYVNCIDDPDYVPPEEGEWISDSTDTGPDNVKVLTLSCPDGTKLEEGKCEPDGNTHVNPGDSKSYGDNGWYCEFTGDRGGRAMGEIFIYCVPETTGSYLGQEEAITKLMELGVEVYHPCPNENCNDSVADCGEGTDDTYVCLNGLPSSVVEKLDQIKKDCDCNVLVTGGTEKFGHDDNTPHGYGEAVVDLENYSEFENWFKNNSYEDGPSWCPQYGTGYELNDGSAEFCDEGDHLHFELK